MLQEMLGKTKDFRINRCNKHNLVDILMIVLVGILCGYKDIEEIHFNAQVSEDELKKRLELPNGIPSADTIPRVLAGIDGRELERILARYAKSVFGEGKGGKAQGGNTSQVHYGCLGANLRQASSLFLLLVL